jgi:hypothetical protein
MHIVTEQNSISEGAIGGGKDKERKVLKQPSYM